MQAFLSYPYRVPDTARDSKFLRVGFVTFIKSNAKALLTASPSKMQTRKRVLRSSPEWLYGSASRIKLPCGSL